MRSGCILRDLRDFAALSKADRFLPPSAIFSSCGLANNVSIILQRSFQKMELPVTTLENATTVLRLFGSERRELSVTDVSRLMEMPKSSASRLLAHMRDVRLLDCVGKPPRYRVGTLFFEVARQHRFGSSVADLTNEVLARVCAETGHTGYVSMLQGTDVIVVRVRQGTQALRVVTPLGQRLPAAQTAIGRALLARLEDSKVRELYRGGLPSAPANSPQSLRALLESLHVVRAEGCAEAYDEALPGVGSTAVSISDPEHQETVGLCLSYSVSLVSAAERRHIAEKLISSAAQLGCDLHDPFWTAQVEKLGTLKRDATLTVGGAR